ncbi:MAG: glycosyl hydrolase [bacterium]
MKKSFFLFVGSLYFSFFLIAAVYSQNQDIYPELSNGFRTPPHGAQPVVYHWWLGGDVDTVRLREELQSFKEAGISGFTIFEIGSRDTVLVGTGPAFLGDESLETLKFAIEEAGNLGLDVGLNTASSWNAGGAWLQPEHAGKSIYYSKATITGGNRERVELPFPEIPEVDPRGRRRLIEYGPDGKPVFSLEVAVLAIPSDIGPAQMDTSNIRNISQYFDPETELLNWEAPPGEWEVVRYVCSNSGENLILPSRHSEGPIVDHYDAASTEFHFTYIIERLQSVLGDLRNTALKSLYMASYEARGFTWTTTLPEEFRSLNGYDVYKFIPALFEDDLFNPELTAHFKSDFQLTLSELMINGFYKKSKEICNKHGLKNNCEAGGPGLPLHNVPVEPIKALGGGLDIPRGEFWINHNRFNEDGIDILRVVKEVSSASHIYGRNIVEMEAFTTFMHWQVGPFEMKPIGDRAFAEGMNKVVVHGSTHNPPGTGYPGIVYHAGVHYNDKRIWWPKIRPFNEYMSRISYILQEADFKADVLFYYGDTIPNFGGHKNSRFTAGPGYDYEIINTEILLELIVRDSILVLPRTGAEFKILALASEYEINPDVLLKLNDLAGQGAVIIGEKPSRVRRRRIHSDMTDLERVMDNLWTGFNTRDLQRGRARVYSGIEPSQMLRQLNVVPDFSYADKEFNTLDYTHYAKDDVGFYFIRNTTGEWLSRDLGFRQQNKVPEIWDPVSGEIVPVSIYSQGDDYINLPVTLAPYGSTFVVFREGRSNLRYNRVYGPCQHPPFLQYAKEGIYFWEEGVYNLSSDNLSSDDQSVIVNNHLDMTTIEGPWEVLFPEGWGAPESAFFPQLKSWTESDNEGIKYFSGIARHEKSFVHEINSNSLENPKVFLDLGDLSHVGEVWLNDKPLGITWAKPYRFDITEELKPGENTLIIEIANTWSNRITGDALTGEKYTSTHHAGTIVPDTYGIRLPWAEVPLIESGLFGPVTITTIKPFINN